MDPLRLATDLEARWLKVNETERGAFILLPHEHGAQGVMFKCPVCYRANGGPAGTHQIVLWLVNPIGVKHTAPAHYKPAPRWARSGITLETLTLRPSIAVKGGCEAHFWVTDGKIDPA